MLCRVALGRGFDSHRGQKIFSWPRGVPCFPLLGLTPSGLFMGLSSTIIYTSELILCSTHSASKHLVQKLNDKEIPPTEIMQITGHRKVNSVNNYSCLSEKQKEKGSGILPE